MGAALSPCSGCLGSQRRESTRPSLRNSVAKLTPSTLCREDLGLLQRLEEVNIPSPREQLLTSIDEKAELFYEIVRAPASADADLDLVVERDGCKVYSKTIKDGFALRSEWTAAFPPKVYLDFLCDIQHRKSWDKHLAQAELVEQLTADVTVYYQAYHKVVTISGRDLVLACKKFTRGGAWVDACCSVDLPTCPPKEDFVRASVALGGYFIEETEGGCRVVCYTEGSLGGALPQALVKKFSAINVPRFVHTVAQSLHSYLGTKT